jgi:hypothetical protein
MGQGCDVIDVLTSQRSVLNILHNIEGGVATGVVQEDGICVQILNMMDKWDVPEFVLRATPLL